MEMIVVQRVGGLAGVAVKHNVLCTIKI